VDIYPGMAMQKNAGQLVAPLGSGDPYGLSDFFEAPTLGIRQITDSGINACAVWVLDPDAEFQVLPPAFDTTLAWAEAGGGAMTPVFAYTSGAKQGQLAIGTGAGIGTKAVARLLNVSGTGANSVITIGGLPSS
jgi:hypothetical protein